MPQKCQSQFILTQGDTKQVRACWLVEDHDSPHECPVEGSDFEGNNKSGVIRWVNPGYDYDIFSK